jgi:hypothetical protein
MKPPPGYVSAADFLPAQPAWVQGIGYGTRIVKLDFELLDHMVWVFADYLSDCVGCDMSIGVVGPTQDQLHLCEISLSIAFGECCREIRIVVASEADPRCKYQWPYCYLCDELYVRTWDEAWYVLCGLLKGLAPLQLRFASVEV